MADIREQRIYCAEQIVVPDELPNILKHYSKAVIKENPPNIVAFSAKYMEYSLRYFKSLLEESKKGHNNLEKPDSKAQR